MKKLLLLAALLITTQAHAWGDREQGILSGIVGATLLNQIAQPRYQQPYYGGVQQIAPPIFVAPTPPVRVYSLPRVPYYGATPLYEKRTQYDPNCNCYVAVYNQYGWQ
jgi:hypothetical protein